MTLSRELGISDERGAALRDRMAGWIASGLQPRAILDRIADNPAIDLKESLWMAFLLGGYAQIRKEAGDR